MGIGKMRSFSPALGSSNHRNVISSVLILNCDHFGVFWLRSCVEFSFKFE